MAHESTQKGKKDGLAQDSVQLYKAADDEESRLLLYFFPFVQGSEQAKDLKSKGFILKSWDGKAVSADQTVDVDPIVAVFMVAEKAYAPGLVPDPGPGGQPPR